MSIASVSTSFMTSCTSGWSGIWMSPSIFSWQAATSGKTEASRSSERMRWICGGTFLPFWKRSSASARVASQRQRVPKDRRRQRRLLKNRLHGFGLQELKDVGQRKAVLLGERDVQPVVGGRRLQFEVEAAAEALAQREAPGLVDAAAERRMNDQLHAAAFVEEALGNDRCPASAPRPARRGLAGCIQPPARRRSRRARIPASARRRRRRLSGLFCDTPTGRRIGEQIADLLAQFGDMARELLGARRRFAAPEGNAGRRAVRILHQHAAELASTRRIRHDVLPSSMMSPVVAFHREVFVERADHDAFRLRHHGEQRSVGNRAAAGDGGEPAAAARAQFPVHAVAMQVRAVASAPGGDAFGQASRALRGRSRARDRGTDRRGEPSSIQTRTSPPLFSRHTRDNLLRKHVERAVGNDQAVEIAVPNGAHQRGALEQVIARGGEEAALGNGAAPVARRGQRAAARRQSSAANRSGITRSTVPMSMPSSSEAVATRTLICPSFNLLFRSETKLARQATVMRGDIVFAEALAQVDAQRAPPCGAC